MIDNPKSLRSLQIRYNSRTGIEGLKKQSDYSQSDTDTNVDVFFDDLPNRLIGEINQADAVVGCVAWLTHPEILDALSKIECVSIVVQKMKNFAPDHATPEEISWVNRLRSRYNKLKPMSAFSLEETRWLGFDEGKELDGIRCLGDLVNRPGDKYNNPKMHHKFLVLCKGEVGRAQISHGVYGSDFEPYAVWTGSFNFTRNAGFSLENAVLIRGVDIAYRYLGEWAQLLALSEPLDWTAAHADPDLRYGIYDE